MPQNDGTTPGANDGAEKDKSGTGDAGRIDNADDKTDKSQKASDDDDGKAGQVVFKSQKELDDLIARRINRATKDANDKAKLTETQRLEKERDDALQLVRDRDLKDEFISQLGIAHGPASRLYKAYKDDIDIDDKGKPANLGDVIKQAKADWPALFRKVDGKGDGSQGSGGSDGKAITGDMNSALRKMAGRG
jgi:hypothetical protein